MMTDGMISLKGYSSQSPGVDAERKTVAEHSVVGSEHRPRSVRRLSDDFFHNLGAKIVAGLPAAAFRRSGWKPLPRDFFTASERATPGHTVISYANPERIPSVSPQDDATPIGVRWIFTCSPG